MAASVDCKKRIFAIQRPPFDGVENILTEALESSVEVAATSRAALLDFDTPNAASRILGIDSSPRRVRQFAERRAR